MYEHLTIEELEDVRAELHRTETVVHQQFADVSRLLEARREERKLEVATDESQRKIEKLIGEPQELDRRTRFRIWLRKVAKI